MEQYVCVRVVKANGMDLALFQFDYDLTFGILLMNADGTIYGRYGSRSEREHADKDISLEGLAAALEAGLELHRQYPANKAILAGKQGKPSPYRTPDDYPSLRGQYALELDYQGQVVRSCMHCHQIRDAARAVLRSAAEPIPDQELFPYPMPSVLGITLDPRQRGTIERIEPDSAASQAGLKPGDRLLRLGGQPLLSTADVQWVLHHAPASGTLEAQIGRGDEMLTVGLQLEDGWRRRADIRWRVSTWPLRRMGTGGLLLERVADESRSEFGLARDTMALQARHVGQYGAHAAAKRAGFQKGDVIIRFDGRQDDWSETDLLAYAMQQTKPGQKVPVTVLRDGRPIQLQLPMQE